MNTANQYPDFTGLTFEKVWAMFQETDKKIRATSEQMKETDRRMKETDREITRLEKQFGHLGNRFGEVVEHLIIPAAIPRFNALGFHFDDTAKNHEVIDSETGKVLAEIDILLENGDSVIAIEIKTKPSLDDVKEHIERLQIFRAHKNRKKIKDDRKIYGAIAAAVCSKDVRKAALKAGFYLLLQGGDTIVIDVPEGFVPTAF